MYGIIKSVIENRNYELTDMLKKIDVLWIQGNITESERDELITLARENAEVKQSIDILLKLEELDKRVKALEESKTDNPGDEDPVETTDPDYEVGKWYYAGDVVKFEGKSYKCIAPEGQVCTWSPVDYPAYWEEV